MELENFMNQQIKEDAKIALDKVVRHLRDLEHDYQLGFSEISGLSELADMFKRGLLTIELVIAIAPAVKYYDKDYEINFC